ncbi:MAG TPA: response regulator [Gemmatimonadales bacterium]|nr:response regulator [Gemmatimonadales bacterium]
MANHAATPLESISLVARPPSISGSIRAWTDPEPEWRRIGLSITGPLLTLAVAIAFDLVARFNGLIPNPTPLLLLTVAYAGFAGGLQPALISALVTLVYGAHYFAEPWPGLFHYTSEGFMSLAALAFATPAIAVLTGRQGDRTRSRRAGPALERLARRHALQHEITARLALSGDAEDALQSVARAVVPLLGDWCMIQVAGAHGEMEAAAAAHKSGAHELLVRTLCARGWPDGGVGGAGAVGAAADGASANGAALNGVVNGGNANGAASDAAAGGAPNAPRRFNLTRDAVRARSRDGEDANLAERLAPAAILSLPLVAGGHRLGRLLLGRARGGWLGAGAADEFDAADLRDASEIAQRVALALGHGRLARACAAADERQRLLFAAHPRPMWIFDVETLAILEVNDAAIHFYGYAREELLAMTIMDLHPAGPNGDLTMLLPSLEWGSARRPGVALTQHRRHDGSVVDVEIVSHELTLGATRARLALATDVTERTRALAALHATEDQLRQAQRREAVVRLAAGIAHDFNNVLTAIQGYSDLLLRDLEPADARRHDAMEIGRAAERGAVLTRQLLAFAGHETREPALLDLNAMIVELETLMQRLVGAEVRLATVLSPRLGRVFADRAQLEQVLLTLVLNAREAMADGGELTIETSERRVSGVGKGRLLMPGHYAVLTMRDTGAPLRAAPSPDSALGLSIACGIVKQHGGVVRVVTEPERGTTLKIILPLAEGDESTAEPSAAALAGTETVLVVEDEEGVRELLRKVLARYGYQVLEARHGRDALLEVEKWPGAIHLLVTDVVMPEMSGPELAERLRRRRPDLRVIFISGYTSQELLRRGGADADLVVMQKPFTSEEFVQRVREVLDAAVV